jgi:RND superfamily putative drug exporter
MTSTQQLDSTGTPASPNGRSPSGPPAGRLARLGGAAAAHPWRVIAAWVVLLAVAALAAGASGGTTRENYDVPGMPSYAGLELLREQFPDAAGAADRVVLHADGPLDPADVDLAIQRLGDMPHVIAVSPPRLSEDGSTALLDVRYDVPVTDEDLMANMEPLESALDPVRAQGVQVEFGGEVPDSASLKISGAGEVIGVLVALGLLLLTFRSMVAAGLPIAVALAGLGVGSSGVVVLAAVMDVSTTAPTVATMVGLGVGIDYAMLLVTRHVEFLRAGLTVRDAAASATATAGRSVLFAGATVLVSLMGLRLADVPTYSSFGFATAISVTAVMLAALTLVPALLGLGGRRVLPRAARASHSQAQTDVQAEASGWTARWAHRVGRRPLPWALGALVLLVTLAAPVLDLRMWPADIGAQPQEMTTRRAHDLIAEHYGPGANGPFVVAVDLQRVPAESLSALRESLGATDGVASVTAPVIAPAGGAATLVLEPATAPGAEGTAELVERLRDDVLPAGAELTGQTPVLVDITELLADRIWLVIAFVVAVSFVLLVLVFRSPVIAAKAAIMNMLSIGAAYGVVVAVFQWGWGSQLLGLDHGVPISSWIPILMFAVAFGLSMDYEVFLLGRIREEWLRTGDARASVVNGLAATARVITAAAAIMIAVFLGFASEGDLILKQMGLGMAAAILIDATVVRMVLVPAAMALLGKANWWLPRWLDRALPRLDV